ncbi:MAG: outer membrane protein assembly factor BamA [Deltaproteobacteria bacterium]|nr:outer membrane protein assembly factor BamA [Deltaproteobacteria bacterium]
MAIRNQIGVILIFVACVFFPSASLYAGQRIAVMPLSLFSAGESQTALAVQSTIDAVLASDNRFEVIPSKEVSKALGGYEKYSESVAPAIARELKADIVLFGTVLEFGSQISLNPKVWLKKENKVVPLRAITGMDMEHFRAAINDDFSDSLLLSVGIGKSVGDVLVVGNAKIGTAAIMQRITQSKGQLYKEADVAESVKAVFRMGFFDDVTVKTSETGDGVIVTYTIKEKPSIREINISGNDKIEEKQLRSLISTKKMGVFNPEQVAKDAEGIKQFYRSKGFFNVEVNHYLGPVDETTASADLHFEISEKKKLYITSIVFRGNTIMSDKDILEAMQTKKSNFFSFITDKGILKEDILKQDVMRIEALYMSRGFINVKISAPQIKYTEKGIDIIVEVQEGRRYRMGNVTIGGDTLKEGSAKILGKLSLPKREFFDQSALIMDRELLVRLAQDEGYAFANVKVASNTDDINNTIDIEYELAAGRPVQFGRILVSGNTVTREKVILRALAFSEGELFSRSNLEASHRSLTSLGFFSEININPEKGVAQNATDIRIQVKEKPTGSISAGVGYSASDKASITAQIAKANLLGYGQQLNLQGTLSGTTLKFTFSFVDPYLFDYNLWSRFEAWDMTTNYDEYDLDSRGVAVTFSRALLYNIAGSISYRLARDNVFNVKSSAAESIKSQAGLRTKSSATLGFSKEEIDNFLFPTRGYSLSTQITHVGLGGDIKFDKVTVSARYYEPINDNLVLSLYGTAGAINELEGGNLPTYERFTLGGIGTLTGLSEIGPRDPATNSLIGGKGMMCYAAEVGFPLVRDAGLMAAVFYNTGNAWASARDYNFEDMRHTMGYGIRWNSPIGPIRLEWGYPLDRKEGEPAYRMEFSLGMRF